MNGDARGIAMDLADAQAARNEAWRTRLDDAQARRLADACRHRRARLGPDGVRAHRVNYDPRNWPDLPDGVGDGTSVTRGHVFDAADGPALDVFTASYVFGWGKRGYGPSRYKKIRDGAPDLGEILERVREIGRCQGPIFAYAQLYGGPDYEHRTRPGTPPWSRIARYGPAFFTKFLYFTVPGALILDAKLARRVARLAGKEDGYVNKGHALAWSPRRYAIYLHWMRQAASDVSRHAAPDVVSPELLELTLFDLELADLPERTDGDPDATEMTDTDDEGDAAD